MGRRFQRWARVASLAAALHAWPSEAMDVSGTYRLAGTAEVAAPPAVDRSVEVHADAALRPGPAPGDVLVMIGARGGRCELRARLDAAGLLRFPADQRCAVELDAREARGHLDGVLRSGTGRLGDESLEVDLAFDVDGAVSVRTASRVDVLGRTVDVPSAWMPEVPVHGRTHAIAQGRRDRSRAAER